VANVTTLAGRTCGDGRGPSLRTQRTQRPHRTMSRWIAEGDGGDAIETHRALRQAALERDGLSVDDATAAPARDR
jgi:hypothetical protein